MTLAGELLALADLGIDRSEGRRRAEEALAAGRAAEHFERWCYVQGGRWKPGEYHRLAGREVKAERGGWLGAVDARVVGLAAQCSGRRSPARATIRSTLRRASCSPRSSAIAVEAGETLATVYAREAGRREDAAALLARAFTVADTRPASVPVVLGRA